MSDKNNQPNLGKQSIERKFCFAKMCLLVFKKCQCLPVLIVPEFGRVLHGNIFSISVRQFGDTSNRLYPSFDCRRTRFSDNVLSSLKQVTASSKPVKDSAKGALILVKNLFTKIANSTKSRMVQVPKVKLNNGQEAPVFGLGTYASKHNEGEEAVKYAIDCGYRHIDTAFFYQNEAEIGKAVKDKIAEGVIKREDMFVVTKLWSIHHDPEKVEYACRKSLENLGFDYIDLYLMHLPVGYAYINDNTLMPKDDNGTLMLTDVDYLDTWKAMEKLVKQGLVRSIGVSNFNSEQVDRVLKNCEIKPVTNQVECHPGVNQKKLIQFCKERDIVITAYCPLGRPNPQEKKPEYLYDDKVKAIADKYGKTTSQIGLRYMIDIGTIPIPKSTNPERIRQNIDIFDFKLTDSEIQTIDSFHTGERLVPFLLIKAQNHKYFPFKIEF